MNFFEKLGRMDRRWFYLLMTAIVLIPLLRPLGLPIAISDTTKQAWEVIQTLKPGDKVLFGFLYSLGSAPDVDPGARAIFAYCMKNNVKVICVSFVQQGDMMAENVIKYWEDRGKVYGVDFINLGYVAGMEPAVAAIANSVYAVSVDYRGNPVNPETLPILEGITDASTYAMTFSANTGTPGPEEWVRQIADPFKRPYVTVHVTIGSPRVMPYVQSGQVAGLIIGMRGSAELEVLSKWPGPAAGAMDCQSLGHFAILGLMLLGNIGYWTERRRKAAEQAARTAAAEAARVNNKKAQ